MDLLRVAEASLRLQHRHGDGSWGTFEPAPSHHSPSEHDPERDWGKGTIYRCTSCDEEVVVSKPEDPGAARS
jgi:hypothetical protein